MRFNRRSPPPGWIQLATDLLESIITTGVLKNEAVYAARQYYAANAINHIKKQH